MSKKPDPNRPRLPAAPPPTKPGWYYASYGPYNLDIVMVLKRGGPKSVPQEQREELVVIFPGLTDRWRLDTFTFYGEVPMLKDPEELT